MTVTILAVLAAIGGTGAVLGVFAGFAIHGLDSLDTVEALIVFGALVLAALYLAAAHAAWSLRPGGWTVGVVAGVASIVFVIAVLIRGWADLMVDAPLLAWTSVLVIVIAAVSLRFLFRSDVKAAFQRT